MSLAWSAMLAACPAVYVVELFEALEALGVAVRVVRFAMAFTCF